MCWEERYQSWHSSWIRPLILIEQQDPYFERGLTSRSIQQPSAWWTNNLILHLPIDEIALPKCPAITRFEQAPLFLPSRIVNSCPRQHIPTLKLIPTIALFQHSFFNSVLDNIISSLNNIRIIIYNVAIEKNDRWQQQSLE